MTKTWKFKSLLQEGGWTNNSYIATDSEGIIRSISTEKPTSTDHFEKIPGLAIPGFQNAHSHSFQYAMAGLAEIHPNHASNDDFWSWRETMYNIALSIDPDQFEAIAAMLYAQMLSHGYTHVAEFHYLHHHKNGHPYAHLAEMGERLVAAAKTSGIGITLVPIFYQKGGFGKEPEEKQRRFISKNVSDYWKLFEASQSAISYYDKATIALGIHSLRAVAPEAVVETLSDAKNYPIHIHIAEQLQEVEDCLAFHYKRPVEWLLENTPVNPQYHLIHATHLVKEEIHGIAKSGAHVVLCPSTEGNLGDGIFPLKDFQNQKGRWSIGTDSHIGLNPLEELRMLDYGQRLTTHKRNQFISSENGNSGRFAFDMALKSGRRAMGKPNDQYFKIGEPLDAVIIDAEAPLIATSQPENILSSLVYSGDRSVIYGTITNGRWCVKEGRHMLIEEISERFAKTIREAGLR